MIRYQASPADAATPPPSCRAAMVARMADTMREMAFADETVSVETLTQRGWTLPVVKRLSPEAMIIARRASVRRLS